MNRCVLAQEHDYARALVEIRGRCKRTHWMGYVFPQLDGLGFSETARRYAIRGLAEARAYLDHPVLGPRLIACAEAVLAVQGRSASAITPFGAPASQPVSKTRGEAGARAEHSCECGPQDYPAR
ncbi:DUF1810 family protein [Thiocapsa sp.]|uniref:DUF1810 family protein n=1 Tax=Thiocapsa sp. TaxID=2024551 RepID=UPI00359423FC